jgi:hypothetical protein
MRCMKDDVLRCCCTELHGAVETGLRLCHGFFGVYLVVCSEINFFTCPTLCDLLTHLAGLGVVFHRSGD